MDEDDKARPVSGEIMTGSRAHATPRREEIDIADAEYETVERPRAPAAPRFPETAPAAGMDFLRAGAAVADSSARHGGPLFWAFGLALVALAFWISGGHALVRQHLPERAPVVAREPLRIGDVETRVEPHNGREILFVDGHAENHGGEALVLPPIEIVITGNDGGATRYFLGTRGTELAPGGRYSFSSRLEAPRNGVRSVSVTFQEGSR